MALQRDYQAPQLNVQTGGQLTQSQVAQADTSVKVAMQVGDNTWKDRLLADFAKKGQQFADKAADLEISTAYLDGQASTGIIQSEEELQGNPLTRDWKVAGYRDTMGKLALADTQAKFQLDIKSLREGDAESMQRYVSQRRKELEPALASMSREARAASMGKLLLQDREAISTWTTEHAKFITERKIQALDTTFSVSNNALTAARMGTLTDGAQGQENYLKALQNTAGVLVADTWLDSGLTPDIKGANTTKSISLALQDDNVGLYEYLHDNPVPDNAGGASTLLSRLPVDDQTKLAGQYREAMARTDGVRNAARHEQLAIQDVQIANGTFTDTYEGYKSTLQAMLANGTIKDGAQYQSRLESYLNMHLKNEQGGLAAIATANGDIQALHAMGMTEEQGLDAIQSQLVKSGATPRQQLDKWLYTGQHGSTKAYAKAGELLNFSVKQMATSVDGDVLKQHMEIFQAASDQLSSLAGEARSVARVDVLSGMADDTRLFASQVFAEMDKGNSLEGAKQVARQTYESNAKLSPSARAAMSAVKATDVEKAIQEIHPQGFFGGLWGTLKAITGGRAANEHILNPQSNDIFSTHPAAAKMASDIKVQLRNETQDEQLKSPTADANSVIESAMAGMARRAIVTKSGALIAPAGTDLEKMFNVGAGNLSAIGPAIDALLVPPKDGAQYALSFSEGRILTQLYGSNGTILETRVLDTSQVKGKLKELDAQRTKYANQVYGSGTTWRGDDSLGLTQGVPLVGTGRVPSITSDSVTTQPINSGDKTTKNVGGVSVTFNGTSTSGAPATWVYDFRASLLKHEGLTEKAYRDLSGKLDKKGNPIMTNGVGVSSHNKWYPKPDANGNITSEQATTSFLGASDDAAGAGYRMAKALNLNSASGFQLLSELAYQSGEAFASPENGNTGKYYRNMLTAIKTGDANQAKEAFKLTAAWFASRDKNHPNVITKRQQDYLNLVEQATKGQ